MICLQLGYLISSCNREDLQMFQPFLEMSFPAVKIPYNELVLRASSFATLTHTPFGRVQDLERGIDRIVRTASGHVD